MCRRWEDYNGNSPASLAAAAARISSGPLFRTLPTFGLASVISISSDSRGRSRSSGKLLRLFPVQPAVVVTRMQDDRHPRMHPGHQFIRFRRHDGEGLEPVPLLVFPGVPEAREAQQLPFASSKV